MKLFALTLSLFLSQLAFAGSKTACIGEDLLLVATSGDVGSPIYAGSKIAVFFQNKLVEKAWLPLHPVEGEEHGWKTIEVTRKHLATKAQLAGKLQVSVTSEKLTLRRLDGTPFTPGGSAEVSEGVLAKHELGATDSVNAVGDGVSLVTAAYEHVTGDASRSFLREDGGIQHH